MHGTAERAQLPSKHLQDIFTYPQSVLERFRVWGYLDVPLHGSIKLIRPLTALC